jgi:hypothetical protein
MSGSEDKHYAAQITEYGSQFLRQLIPRNSLVKLNHPIADRGNQVSSAILHLTFVFL